MRQRDNLQLIITSAIDQEEREMPQWYSTHETASTAHDLTDVRVI
jgi:hypothetical protein